MVEAGEKPRGEDATRGAGLLDRLLALVDVDGRLEVRCELGAGWSLTQEAQSGHHIPFHVLLDGEAVVDADGLRSVPMRAGDVLMLPGGGAHRLRDRDPASLRRPAEGALLCGRFIVPASSARLLHAMLPPALVVHADPSTDVSASASASALVSGARLSRLLALMREESDAPGEGGAALLRHLSGALFAVALRAAMGAWRSPDRPDEAEARPAAATPSVLALGAHPRLAALAVDFLGDLGRDWTLDAMAERAALSRSSLIRAFQAAAGVSPAEFLTHARMTEAARRLRGGREPVAVIGEAVGYASEAAFQRAFKREVGVTPAAWRDGVEASAGDGHSTAAAAPSPASDPGAASWPVRKRLAG